MTRIVTTTYRYKPPPKRRKPVAIPQRIVTYVPQRQQDAWTRYLRLTGLPDPDAPQPP